MIAQGLCGHPQSLPPRPAIETPNESVLWPPRRHQGVVSLEKLIQRNVISDSLIIENEYWVAKKLNKVDPYDRAMGCQSLLRGHARKPHHEVLSVTPVILTQGSVIPSDWEARRSTSAYSVCPNKPVSPGLATGEYSLSLGRTARPIPEGRAWKLLTAVLISDLQAQRARPYNIYIYHNSADSHNGRVTFRERQQMST